MNKRQLLNILLFAFSTSIVSAQYSPEFNDYKIKYAKESQVEIENNNVLEISLKGGEINILEKSYSEKIYLNSTAKYQSKESLVYSSFYSIDKIQASSVNFLDGKYKEYKVSDFKEKDELGTSTFFDDNKSVNFYYQGLDVGSKTKLAYNTNIKNPRFLGAYYFGDFAPVEKFNLKIIADKNIAMNFIEMYMDTVDVEFTKSEKGNKNIYEWKLKNIKSYVNNSDAINHRYRIPHIIPHIKYYTTNGDTTYILNSPKDLYMWYKSLTKDLNSEPCDNTIKVLVDSLTRDCKTNLEKAKNIYYWTQQNIKYVAFENGLGGFIPRDANDVFKKKYGDCKDNSSLLEQMLKEAGMEGHLTWIGTRSIPYKYSEVYTPIVDNHMILTYFDNDKPYFLDATGRFLDMELPSSFIQGKEALIAIDEENYKIIEVPVVKNTTNAIKENLVIDIDSNNIVIGSGNRTYTGYEKTNIYNRIDNIKDEKRLKDYYKNILEKGNNNFLLDSFEEHNKYEYEKDFVIDYTFNLRNYISRNGNNIYINLNLNPYDVAALKVTPPLKGTVDYTHQFLGEYKTTLNIPNNYEVEYLPKDVNVSNELCNIKITYKQEGNSIYYTHTITTNFLMVKVPEQAEINKLIEKIQRNFKEVVVLKLKEI